MISLPFFSLKDTPKAQDAESLLKASDADELRHAAHRDSVRRLSSYFFLFLCCFVILVILRVLLMDGSVLAYDEPDVSLSISPSHPCYLAYP